MVTSADLCLNGSFETGFSLTLYLKKYEGAFNTPQLGNLPPNLTIKTLYEQWWSSYVLLLSDNRSGDWEIDESLPEQIAINQPQSKQEQIEFCQGFWEKLQREMREWFESSNADLNSIESTLNREFALCEESRLLIIANNLDLWKLPWFEWEILQTYQRVGIGFSLPNLQNFSVNNLTKNELNNLTSFNNKNLKISPKNLFNLIKEFPKYLENYSTKR
jgi:hypothetical protein